MRLVTLAVAALLVLIQYPLWLGDGGWLKVWDKERTLAAGKRHNDELRMRNAALDAEVRDLRDGTSAMEERARFELGMIRSDELFVQVIEPGKAATGVATFAPAMPPVAAAAASAVTAAPAPAATPAASSADPPAASVPPATASHTSAKHSAAHKKHAH